MHLQDVVIVTMARRRRGLCVLGGLAALLAGVEKLLRPAAPKTPASTPRNRRRKKAPRKDYFSIRRTKSDLGFTYWVLQGHGRYASFELFDSWAEAIAGAEARLLRPDPEPTVAVLAR